MRIGDGERKADDAEERYIRKVIAHAGTGARRDPSAAPQSLKCRKLVACALDHALDANLAAAD